MLPVNYLERLDTDHLSADHYQFYKLMHSSDLFKKEEIIRRFIAPNNIDINPTSACHYLRTDPTIACAIADGTLSSIVTNKPYSFREKDIVVLLPGVTGEDYRAPWALICQLINVDEKILTFDRKFFYVNVLQA